MARLRGCHARHTVEPVFNHSFKRFSRPKLSVHPYLPQPLSFAAPQLQHRHVLPHVNVTVYAVVSGRNYATAAFGECLGYVHLGGEGDRAKAATGEPSLNNVGPV